MDDLPERRRRSRTQALIAVAAGVLVIGAGVAVAARNGNSPRTVRATTRTPVTTTEDQGTAPPSTSTTVPATSTSTTGVRSTAPAPRPTVPPQSTTTAANLGNDNVSVLTLTEADDGKSYTVRRGNQGVEVRLSNSEVWTEPQTSDPAVLARTSVSTSSDGGAQATFMATGDGQAAITAEGRSHPQPCQTAQPPCMIPDHVRQFHVNITVVG